MENLNDAEFGGDNSGEEAPILVAQRYLNIFRQVHIFNKAKRDEFDDELLALPQNVTDFFKRMPGGRLLVEHIEKVKTERGIAFVKANRSDFDEGAGKTDSPAPAMVGGAVQVAGGCITLDPSFAETLAQSLANAFKQMPAAPSAFQPNGRNATVTADFGDTFNVIADEIRTSRASLLDVLKETRSITDSVIASQVSISRILEGILSSRTRDDNDIADLNNRIIASQAAITKLLEGLYSASNKKNTEISDYLNVENRLQTFRSEIKNEISLSLRQIQEMFKEYAETVSDKKVVIETISQPLAANIEKIAKGNNSQQVVSSDYDERTAVDVNTADMEISSEFSFGENEKEATTIKSSTNFQSLNDDGTTLHFDPVTNSGNGSNLRIEHTLQDNRILNEEHKRKKRKKKKNRENSADVVNNNLQQLSPQQNFQEIQQSEVSVSHGGETVHKNKDHSQQILSAFSGTIRNKAYKHDDNFDHIRLDVPPLDMAGEDKVPENSVAKNSDMKHSFNMPRGTGVQSEKNTRNNTELHMKSASAVPSDVTDDDFAVELSSLDDLYEDTDKIGEYSTKSDNSITSDDVDDTLLNHSVSFDSDDLDFALPESMAEQKHSSDKLFSGGFSDISSEHADFPSETSLSDDLDFALPDEVYSPAEESETDASTLATPSADVSEAISDDLTFTLPESSSSPKEIDDMDRLVSQSSIEKQAEEENTDNGDFSEDNLNSFSQESSDTEQGAENITTDYLSTNNVFSMSGVPQGKSTDTDDTNGLDSFLASNNTQEDLHGALSSPERLDFMQQNDVLQSEVKDNKEENDTDTISPRQERPSRYGAELDKIRAALTADDIDISSLDEPIALDEYSDDENVGKDEDMVYEDDYSASSVSSSLTDDSVSQDISSSGAYSNNASDMTEDVVKNSEENDEDWEWEYVDEDGDNIPAGEDEDWEWEYVEDENEKDKPDNNKQ